MAIKSILKDERINAYNVLIEISISEYLKFARNVIDNNEFQRKKVIKSKIKEILKDDLLRNCLIPSIVLAVSNENIKTIKDEDDTQSSEEIINNAIRSNEILIIDGLQRTYVLLSLEEELLKKGDEDALQKLYKHKIRAEVYLGLNRIGLLYRMITLNTGQTTMSTRHLMEILYLDYARIGVNGIKLIKDKEETQISLNTDEFNFKTILDGFNSYLEKNEGLIERTEILDNIKSLDVIKDEEINKDLFKDFLLTYKVMLDQLVLKTNSWKNNTDDIEEQALKLNTNAFGKSILDIFKKSQVLTGFGAAIGHLKEAKNLSLTDIEKMLPLITAENDDWNTALCHLLKQLDLVKEKSKKIGNDQRYFFKFFFRGLLNPDSDQYLNFNKSSDFAFNRTREDKF
ncbi:MAG: hypothetical protein A2266_04045 [Bacteroidetes bacterium RIFOXYA12_FULL_40_10]|nr:MAG: hypothetical protein A2266_04045 [Bacteroidetes bacterium RIFOXYA12_FULL_40_10]